MMIKINYAYISDYKNRFKDPTQLIHHIPAEFHERALKYIPVNAKFAYIIGRLLIMQTLKDFNYKAEKVTTLQETEFGKPFIEGEFSFNISHSGNAVICCGGKDSELGIDIEKIRPIDIKDFKRVFSTNEWKTLNIYEDPIPTFFDLWTKKESVLKADGRGFQADPTKISLAGNLATLENCTLQWNLKKLDISNDYCCYLCCNKPIQEIIIGKLEASNFSVKIL